MGAQLLCRSRPTRLERPANGSRQIINLGCGITQVHAEFPVDSLVADMAFVLGESGRDGGDK